MALLKMDIEDLKTDFEAHLKSTGLTAAATQSNRGDVYKIETDTAEFEFTIGNEWLGYDFALKKHVLGKEIGTSLDTDNYSLGGENTDITQNIYAEALACLLALANDQVLAGQIDSKMVLAFPISNTHYRLIERGRFLSYNKLVTSNEISELKPLSSYSYS